MRYTEIVHYFSVNHLRGSIVLRLKNINVPSAVKAGMVAGFLSGLVKLGWEDVLPPRTPQRDATNPPQAMLEKFGVPTSITHSTYTYSEQKMPWVSFIIHFGFSATFAVGYSVMQHMIPPVRLGHGTLAGLGLWGAFHLGVLPKMGLTPDAKDLPIEEQVSEALGHIAWMSTIDLVSNALYQGKQLDK